MSQSDSRKVKPKRRDHPAYMDGMTRAYLAMAEAALIRLLVRGQPEYEKVTVAFQAVLDATEIVNARLERRR